MEFNGAIVWVRNVTQRLDPSMLYDAPANVQEFTPAAFDELSFASTNAQVGPSDRVYLAPVATPMMVRLQTGDWARLSDVVDVGTIERLGVADVSTLPSAAEVYNSQFFRTFGHHRDHDIWFNDVRAQPGNGVHDTNLPARLGALPNTATQQLILDALMSRRPIGPLPINSPAIIITPPPLPPMDDSKPPNEDSGNAPPGGDPGNDAPDDDDDDTPEPGMGDTKPPADDGGTPAPIDDVGNDAPDDGGDVGNMFIPVGGGGVVLAIAGAGAIQPNDVVVRQPLPTTARIGFFAAVASLLVSPFVYMGWTDHVRAYVDEQPSPALLASIGNVAGDASPPRYVQTVMNHNGDYTEELDARVTGEREFDQSDGRHGVLVIRGAAKADVFEAAQSVEVQRSNQRGVSGMLVAAAGIYAGWQVGGTTGMLLGAAFLGLGAWTYM